MRLASLSFLFCGLFFLSASPFSSTFSSSFSVMASNLPAEHESARLLLVIEEAVNQGEWERADKNLTQIASLQTELPTPFYYYNGLVHSQLKRYEKAQRSLEHYVVKTGPSGAFYYEALRLLTTIENKYKKTIMAVENASQSDKENPVTEAQAPLLVSEERDTYIQTLKALFLTDNALDALVMQINSLLNAHPYTGVRLKKATAKQGLKYRISVQGNVIVLQETSYLKGFPRLSASRLDVSGLDPFVSYQCSKQAISCWLYHPASSHDVWLKIDEDELVANELSQTFTRLIQLLQKQ